MSAQEYAFGVLAIVGGISAIRMVTARNVVHAALYLVVTLAMVAGAYLLLAAEFVAWVQILIYVGAIVILFLFGLMLTKAPIGRETLDNQRRGAAVLVALAILAGLVFLIQEAFPWDGPKIEPTSGGTAEIGASIFSRFVLPFEVVSFLLLAALIGAIVLSRKDDALVIRLSLVLFFSAFLFAVGVYGVLARRNAVLVLMSIELMLNAVNVNLVAFGQALGQLSRAGVRAVRDRRGRGRGRHRARDRDLDLPQPGDDQRRRGEPPQVVAQEAHEGVAAANWFVQHAWLIAFLPFVSAALTLFLGKRTPGRGAVYGIAAVGAGFVLSLGVLCPVRPARRRHVRGVGHLVPDRRAPHGGRPARRRPHGGDARGRHLGLALRARVLARLHGGRLPVHLVLRRAVPVHRRDARTSSSPTTCSSCSSAGRSWGSAPTC